ncbi:hypothetical protein HDU76_013320 [Blyttiomyces sp. JEL0837]|nr:hypothetical protein HDU76_013320 [Blyttiomyces sp. JEL0837]
MPNKTVSVVYVYFVVFWFFIMACVHGLNPALMPAVGPRLTSAPPLVIGQVLFNYTLANTIPSWVNTKHPRVSVHRCVWWSVFISTVLYVATGIFGGLSFPVPESSNLLTVMANIYPDGAAGGMVQVIALTYPILVLLTSIPVAFIIVRLNLITSRICSRDWATFWGSIFPFIICIPLQTGDASVIFANWTSLIFQSLMNFIAPFLIYIYLDRRNLVMQQSVIDELENLDLDGAVKKRALDDDDFDYVYHLPHADLTRLGTNRYDPFAKMENHGQSTNTKGVSQPKINVGSSVSLQSRKLAKVLNLTGELDTRPRRPHGHALGSHMSLNDQSGGSGLGVPGGNLSRRGSFMTPSFAGSSLMVSVPNTGVPTPQGSYHGDIGGRGPEARLDIGMPGLRNDAIHKSSAHMSTTSGGKDRRTSMGSSYSRTSKKVLPIDNVSIDFQNYNGQSGSKQGSEFFDVNGDGMDGGVRGPPTFRALPEWITNRVSAKIVAWICMVVMAGLSLSVLLYNIAQLANPSIGQSSNSTTS